MIGTILRGYGAVLGSAIRFAALIGVCIATGFLLVYPLWSLAVAKPDLYTLLFVALLATGAVAVFAIRAKKALRTSPGLFLFSLARKAVLATGVVVFILLVLRYERTLAFVSLIVTFFLYGFIAFVLSPEKRSPEGR